MSYVYLGPGSGAGSARYSITLKLYRDCASDGPQLDDTARISIFPVGSTTAISNNFVPYTNSIQTSLTTPDPCITNPPLICYNIRYYTFSAELPFSAYGYVVSYQRCCRINGIFNVINSGQGGATYISYIPGTVSGSTAPVNSTPVFKASDTVIICANSKFSYDFGATDPDNDELEFTFDEAYTSSGSGGGNTVSFPSAPPYSPLTYNFGFSGKEPFGVNVKIDPKTGMVSGIAPVSGIYVITVSVLEKRNGQLINTHRKDLHLKVADCQVASAELPPVYLACETFTLNVKNLASSPLIESFDWDFGVPGAPNNTSTQESASFTYSRIGDYTVRLITNRGMECADTAYAVAKVYPGFNADFKYDESCVGIPYVFTDQSKTAYGVINYWKWDFGNTISVEDTANTIAASYVYPQLGTYNVSLIVANSYGCIDTVRKTISVTDRPAINLTRDTLICNIDTLQLRASGTGKFSWSPGYMIDNVNIANPKVSPDVPTTYYVTVQQAPGCENSDSVFVDVKSFVTLRAGRDTTICLGDSIRFEPLTDGLNLRWSPASSLDDPSSRNPWAKPTLSTRYSLFSTIGKCQALDGFVVNIAPFPAANAGRDTTICSGDTARLFATGGYQYFWYPGNTLDDQTRQRPLARPYQTTDYAVAVYGNGGCPKPAYDTVRVTVVPPVQAFAGNDTVAVIGQPLKLRASGGMYYQWSPANFIDSPRSVSPIAKLNDDAFFVVRVSTEEGCFAHDTVRVRIFKTPPEIFVPTAFTPNGDGLNDRLTPITVGISNLIYFKVYNRFGELVFSTSEIGRGWNGVFKGKDQGNESFVWHVLGVDYLGQQVFKKGQSTLIR